MTITVDQMEQLRQAAELGLLKEQVTGGGRRLRFSMTGKMSMKRADVIALIKAVKGIWDDHPAWGTDYLIVGDTGRFGVTAKMREAQQRGTRIISEDDFVAMLMP